MILKLLLWLIAPITNAVLDRKGPKRVYWIVNLIRFMAAVLHGALFFPSSWMPWNTPINELSGWRLLMIWLPVLIFQMTSFWIVFELILNRFLKRPWLYYDHKEKDSGLIDRFFAWAGPTAHKVAKLAALILCILSAIVIILQRQ